MRWLLFQLTFNLLAVPFVVLTLKDTWRVWWGTGFLGHWLALGMLVAERRVAASSSEGGSSSQCCPPTERSVGGQHCSSDEVSGGSGGSCEGSFGWRSGADGGGGWVN